MRSFFVSALVFSAVLAGLLFWGPPLQADPGSSPRAARTALFDFELIDTSLEGAVRGENAVESERLLLISSILREKLTESGLYQMVDLAPLKSKIEDAGYLHSCNGCEVKLAAQAGAKIAITGVVQKVSNLILNINVYMRDVESGQIIRSASADIRGNTDQSWSHGISWLARNRLLKP